MGLQEILEGVYNIHKLPGLFLYVSNTNKQITFKNIETNKKVIIQYGKKASNYSRLSEFIIKRTDGKLYQLSHVFINIKLAKAKGIELVMDNIIKLYDPELFKDQHWRKILKWSEIINKSFNIKIKVENGTI